MPLAMPPLFCEPRSREMILQQRFLLLAPCLVALCNKLFQQIGEGATLTGFIILTVTIKIVMSNCELHLFLYNNSFKTNPSFF